MTGRAELPEHPPRPGVARRARRILPLVSPDPAEAAQAAISRWVPHDCAALPPLPAMPPPVDPPGVSYLVGDPDGTWRRPGRVHDAVMTDGLLAPDGPEVLRRHDAAALLDLWFAATEWLMLHCDPEVRAFAGRMAEAGEAMRAGATNKDRRAIPLGRLLGLQPPSGRRPGHGAGIDARNRLLRHVRRAVPEWAELTERKAAVAMIASFKRYREGGWQADKERKTAPAAEPLATWWRLLRLGIAKPMPGPDHLETILET